MPIEARCRLSALAEPHHQEGGDRWREAAEALVNAAQWLARHGLQVQLVDQHDFPRDKVCGDGLIPDAHHALQRLGVHAEVMAVAQPVEVGMRLTFCERNAAAARADLTRICAEIREALEPEEMTADLAGALSADTNINPHPARRMAGAIYVSCAGRGGPHFGAPSAELHIIRRALGDVPLVGFFAGGEIAHQELHGYTGVLTVFTTEA